MDRKTLGYYCKQGDAIGRTFRCGSESRFTVTAQYPSESYLVRKTETLVDVDLDGCEESFGVEIYKDCVEAVY